MKKCNGSGECLMQCECICYDLADIKHDICTCIHGAHNGFCPTGHCQPLKCRNYQNCNLYITQWLADIHNSLCINCNIQMGPHEITNQLDDCPVCLENKIMIKLACKHTICLDCWSEISCSMKPNDDDNPNNNKKTSYLCPLCRGPNDWDIGYKKLKKQ